MPSINSKLPDVGTSIFTIMSALATQTKAINLGQGFPDFEMSRELTSLVDKAMKDGYNQYAPMAGWMPLREAIAHKIKSLYGTAVNPDTDITITPGGTYAIYSSLTTVHGALLFFFPTEYRLTPYLAGGIGFGKFAHDVTEPPAEIDRTEVGFNFGGGVTYPMNDAIWLRGDVRLLKHVDDVPTIWRFGAGVTIRIGN